LWIIYVRLRLEIKTKNIKDVLFLGAIVKRGWLIPPPAGYTMYPAPSSEPLAPDQLPPGAPPLRLTRTLCTPSSLSAEFRGWGSVWVALPE